MKHVLLSLVSLLLVDLTGCKKKEADPIDIFQGHWVSETQRSVSYDASGQVESDMTYPGRQDADITANTITFTGYRPDGTSRPSSTKTYTRSGEDLIFAGSSSILVIYHVRSLTSTSFTLESDYYSTLSPNSPRTATSYIPFHR
jgi:hypothetical protein